MTKIKQLTLQHFIADDNALSIGDQLVLLDRPVMSSNFEEPFKVGYATTVIITKGELIGKIDLVSYHAKAPSLVVMMPGQILEHSKISDDFEGMIIIMSSEFISQIDMKSQFQTTLSIQRNPTLQLNDDGLKALTTYYQMLKSAILLKDNEYRLEITKNLTRALYYGMKSYVHVEPEDTKKSRGEQLTHDFIELVKEHCMQYRTIQYYADTMCITPKYLSAVIKQTSNKGAADWIDECVLLQAKVLLNSSNLNIQQIANELNFPSQSFFGKYFKRLTGLSPKEYRDSF